jgi:outer membrane protein assembly factor BamC
MRNQPALRTLAVLLAATLLLPACSMMDKVAPGRDKVDYKKSKTIENLEVPPDLSSDSIADAPDSLNAAEATYSGAAAAQPAGGSSGVLAPTPNVRLERDGNQEWLVVQGTPDQVWPRVHEFWLQQGFLIKHEDPRIGILETDWNENRADIPQGIIRKYIGKALDSLYSSATRDKYRVRLEKGSDPGTTEVYLTHRGVEEVTPGGTVDSPTEWRPRDPDPELEAEMTKRLMVFLGASEQQAQTQLASKSATPARAQLVDQGGASLLVIREDYSRAWRRTGVALDRVGFTVEDRDRSAGTYFVKYNDPLAEQKEKGFLSKLKFWSSKEKPEDRVYRIVLQADGASTNVIVNDDQGVRDRSSTAKRILTLLEEQLR